MHKNQNMSCKRDYYYYSSSLLLLVVLSLVILVSSEGQTNTTVAVADGDRSIDSIFHTKHVYAKNRLPGGASFGIHCKSGDDDLGYHQIGPNAHYMFQFKPSIFRTTLYFCTVSWEGGSVSFDIYRYNRDSDRCDHDCVWVVRMDGVAAYMEGYTYPDMTIPWYKDPRQ